MQEGRPLAFLSKGLSATSKLKSVYEREMMAIVMAVQKWRHYLLGRRFVIRTDQKSLHFLTDQKLLNEEQQKWVSKLLGLQFEIQYRPGLENKAADALSRRPENVENNAISMGCFGGFEELEEAIQQDDKLRQLTQQLMVNPHGHPPFQLRGRHLMYQNRLVVPKQGSHIQKLLHEFHSSPIGGHSGFYRTYKRLMNVFYWDGMKRDIQNYVNACSVCQQNKYEALRPAGLLQPLPIPIQVWKDISMDFIVGLPKAHNVDTILVVVDRLTKYSHFLTLKHPYTAKEVAAAFIKEVVRLHGFPRTIVSDRDRVFMSHFWGEMFKQAGTKLHMSSAYHPQTDGQTEVVNRCLETYLRCFVGNQPRQWPHWIPWAEFWFNTTYSSSTGMSPFKALYGREPPTLLKYADHSSPVDEVNQQLQNRNSILLELKENLLKAQNRMKSSADAKRRDVQFVVDELAYLKLQPYRLKSLANRCNEKLSPRFYGPFRILEKVGSAAYRLELPAGARIHNVFHVSQLKKANFPPPNIQPLPDSLNEDLVLVVEPEEVLNTRKLLNGQQEVLIKWQGLPHHENTWEEYEGLNYHFPSFHLEDKVALLREGIDTTREVKVYNKKRGKRHQGINCDKENN